jgi:hypothetical protein
LDDGIGGQCLFDRAIKHQTFWLEPCNLWKITCNSDFGFVVTWCKYDYWGELIANDHRIDSDWDIFTPQWSGDNCGVYSRINFQRIFDIRIGLGFHIDLEHFTQTMVNSHQFFFWCNFPNFAFFFGFALMVYGLGIGFIENEY